MQNIQSFDEQMLAYRLSAMAILANRLQIPLRVISLDQSKDFRVMPCVVPFLQWVGKLPKNDPLFRSDCERYILVLMASDVGGLLLRQKRAREAAKKFQTNREAIRSCRRAVDGYLAEHDIAFSLAVAWLGPHDNGNPERTLGRLWSKAYEALSEENTRQTLEVIVDDLVARRSITPGEIHIRCMFGT
jgi:hypothetical protein